MNLANARYIGPEAIQADIEPGLSVVIEPDSDRVLWAILTAELGEYQPPEVSLDERIAVWAQTARGSMFKLQMWLAENDLLDAADKAALKGDRKWRVMYRLNGAFSPGAGALKIFLSSVLGRAVSDDEICALPIWDAPYPGGEGNE